MKNQYEKRDNHIVIFANGFGIRHEILVDETDFENVSAFSGTWCVRKGWNTFYAQITVRGANGKRKIAQMHRILLIPPSDLQVDHQNHNGLDNRRQNIRIVTRGENQRNQVNNVKFQSDVDGVTWKPRDKAWMAQPRANGKRTYLGLFDTQLEAEAAVDMFLKTGKHIKRSDPRRTADFQLNLVGVTWSAHNEAWRVQPWVNGKPLHLGFFDTKLEAEAAANMFLSAGMRVKRTHPIAEFQSGLSGVTWHVCAKAWQAKPQINGKRTHLGYFETPTEAHTALLLFLKTGKRVRRSRSRKSRYDEVEQRTLF